MQSAESISVKLSTSRPLSRRKVALQKVRNNLPKEDCPKTCSSRVGSSPSIFERTATEDASRSTECLSSASSSRARNYPLNESTRILAIRATAHQALE